MRELTLEKKTLTLKINGTEFDVLMSDAEVLAVHNDLLEAIKAVNDKDPQSVIAFDRYLTALFAKTLGENALTTISGGAPVAMVRKMEWYMTILKNIDEMYFEILVQEND